jgi:mannose-6-phosphate isomerase-like protein (cupin superfamily)
MRTRDFFIWSKAKIVDQQTADSAAKHGNGAEWFDSRPGEHCCIRVSSANTNRVYAFVEIVSDPGDGTPLHVHQNEDEHLIVLEGRVRLALGDKIFDAEAGTMVALPKNFRMPGAIAAINPYASGCSTILGAPRKRCAPFHAAARTLICPAWPEVLASIHWVRRLFDPRAAERRSMRR